MTDWRNMEGRLAIRDGVSYLTEAAPPYKNEAPLFLHTLPNGAGWFEGFDLATSYLRSFLSKSSGDHISFCGYGGSGGVIVVRDDRLSRDAAEVMVS